MYYEQSRDFYSPVSEQRICDIHALAVSAASGMALGNSINGAKAAGSEKYMVFDSVHEIFTFPLAIRSSH